MAYKDKEREKEYHKANKDRIKEYNKEYRLKSLYCITEDQHRQMFISQNCKCAICGIDFREVGRKNVHTDHNHITDQVRQLLCNTCNSVIGLAKENINTLLKAVEYLNKWNNN